MMQIRESKQTKQSVRVLDVLDRPIAFHRCFVDLTGSITAALFLSQAVYWHGRVSADRGGWWFKSRHDWNRETGLSRYEQESARKTLCKLEILQEARRGIPATLWFRVNEALLCQRLKSQLAQMKNHGDTTTNQSAIISPSRWRDNHQLDGDISTAQLAVSPPTNSETTDKISTKNTHAGILEKFEQAAWIWAQQQTFWRSRITDHAALRRNLQSGKAFRRQVEQALQHDQIDIQTNKKTDFPHVQSTPSPIWQSQQKKIADIFHSHQERGYIYAVRGTECNNTLWLETPNRYVAEWLKQHLKQIKALLAPQAELDIKIRIN